MVTEPSGLNTGFIFASCSMLTSARTCSSVSKAIGPFLDGTPTGLTTTDIPRLGPSHESYGIFFVLGENDTLVDTAIERTAYDTLCASGMPLRYLECAGASHTQAGDRDYQLTCITESGVLEIVRHERVRITERKTTEQFAATLREFGVVDPRRVWMIGNSMRSDINPALETGANAIFVDVDEPWEFDVVDPVHDGFVTVRTFPEAVDYLLSRR